MRSFQSYLVISLDTQSIIVPPKLLHDSRRLEMSAIVVFDIDGVIRDVGGSYRRALADTVAEFTQGGYRPTPAEIDTLKSEGIWNNDWEAARELIYRYFETQGRDRAGLMLDYGRVVAYFQTKYRGTDPVNWNGYICDEPLLATPEYFVALTAAGIPWGFFSGATQGSASYVLERRLGLSAPILVAMEDAPGKPDPQGLFMAVEKLRSQHEDLHGLSIVYVGDTVADMHTVLKARITKPDRHFLAVGILPPHIHGDLQRVQDYTAGLQQAGATLVLNNVLELTPELISTQVQGTGIEPV
jgi:HAD superfamily phosphatase